MPNYNQTLQTNNSSLEEIITQLNNMPDAGEATPPKLQDKTVTPSTSKQTINADSGYDGLDTVTVNAMPTATQATPSVTINSSNGLITATARQSAGYVTAGTKSNTLQLAFQPATAITPTTVIQTAVAPNTYVGGVITVKGDANLVASNIKSGVSIFGVNGIYEGSSGSGVSNGSPNGTAWTMSNITTGNVHKVLNGGGVWVATIDNDFYYSSNGKSWTKSFTAEVAYTELCYANGKWLAASSSSTAVPLYGSSDGKVWEAISNTTMSNITQLIYAQGLYHIVDSKNQYLYSSSNGATWTRQPGVCSRIAYGNGMWAFLGSSNGTYHLRYSTNRISWDVKTFDTINRRGPFYANGVWFMATTSGANLKLYYSIDCNTWQTATVHNELNAIVNIEYANGVWVLYCNHGITHYSLDVKNWYSCTHATDGSFNNYGINMMSYANGIFVACRSLGSTHTLYHSYDGITWHTSTQIDGRPEVNDCCYANGMWVLGTSAGLAYSAAWEL